MAKSPKPNTPSPTQITFSEEDVLKLRAFGSFLTSQAKFNLSIPEAVQLNNHLIFYNTLTQKVEAHIFEVKRIVTQEKVAQDADNTNK